MNLLEKATELGSIMNELNKERGNLTSQLSTIDKRIAAFDHVFECCKLPANVRSIISKNHDACYVERREIKVKLAQLAQIQSNLTKFSAPNIGKIETAGAYILTGEGLTKDEFEMIKPYVLPQFSNWHSAKSTAKKNAKAQE